MAMGHKADSSVVRWTKIETLIDAMIQRSERTGFESCHELICGHVWKCVSFRDYDFLDMVEVGGSNPPGPTTLLPGSGPNGT